MPPENAMQRTEPGTNKEIQQSLPGIKKPDMNQVPQSGRF